MVDEITVEHVPREISKLFYYFLKGSDTICGEVTGRDKDRLLKAKVWKFLASMSLLQPQELWENCPSY